MSHNLTRSARPGNPYMPLTGVLGFPRLCTALWLLLATGSVLAPAQEAPGLVEALRALAPHDVAGIWPAVEELRRSHQNDGEAVKQLAKLIFGLEEKAKLAGASLLLSRKETAYQQTGQIALQQLARDARDRSVKVAAIRLLRKPVRFEEAFLTLKDVGKGAQDLEVEVEVSLALYELDNHPSARAPLLKLLDDQRTGARDAAALALAETGYFQAPVDEVLRGLAREPTERGKYARALLRSANRSAPDPSQRTRPPEVPPERAPPPPVPPTPEPAGASWPGLVAEVERLILKNSLYRDRIAVRDLYLAAVRGMTAVLDEYSVFQDPDEVRQAEAGRLGVYWGLAADLVKPGKSAPLVVARAYRGGAAFEAGLRTGDRLLEVNGVTTHDRDRAELERLTQGSDGMERHLLVARWGWPQPRMLSVRGGNTEPPSVREVMLPEGIGYLKISRIGPNSEEEVSRAVDHMEELGLMALLIDLRDNPGGNLKQAVRIADLFLGESRLPIITERGPSRWIEWTTTAAEKPRRPLALLVNHGTASAAEVIAGSLQDFQRGFLVGETTYGKGVKQMMLPLSTAAAQLLGGEPRLVLTQTRIFLPSGRPILSERSRDQTPGIHAQGLEPDIRVEGVEEAYRGRQLTEVLRVQFSPQVDDYVHRNLSAMRNLYEEGNLWDPETFPGFEELYASLKTTLRRDDVRNAVRSLIRGILLDERGEDDLADYREDATLAAAILELVRRLGRSPLESPTYRPLAERAARG